ncbi:MAG: response regulator [Bdellovibrionota bacterium]|nr:response regulator [Bdellovibrionota bacterium]
MGKKLLIIEDDDSIQQLILRKLSTEFPGLEVISVLDGISAGQEIEYNDFDVIITDMNLPRKDGGSLLKRVRFSKYNRTTPLIVITGQPDFQMRREFAPIHLIPKPFRMKEIISAIKDLLEIDKKSLRKQNESFQGSIFAFEQILKQGNAVVHEISHPYLREMGEDLPGQLHLLFDIAYPTDKVHFHISVEKGLVLRLYNEVSGGRELKPDDSDILIATEEILKVFNQQFLRHFEFIGEEAPKIKTRGCYLTKDAMNYIQAKSHRGLCLEASTTFGKVVFQFFLEPYKSRQAA